MKYLNSGMFDKLIWLLIQSVVSRTFLNLSDLFPALEKEMLRKGRVHSR